MTAVGSDRGLHHGGGQEIVNIVATDNISGTGSADVNAVAIVKLLHDVVDLVVFNDVVMGVQKRTNFFECGLFWGADFVTTNGPYQFTGVPSFRKKLGHDTGDDYAGVWGVVNEVMGDKVFAGLPKEDARRVGMDPSGVMDMVVLNQVLVAEVFGARTVSTDQDAGAANVFDMIGSDTVFLAV